MTHVFTLSFLLVAPFWLLMILAPTWRVTKRLVASPWIVAPAAMLYVILVLPSLAVILPAVMNPDLAGMAVLLSSEAGATIAWVHFLAFDLFVGRWIYLDAHTHGFSPLLMAPVLFFTLMLGPVGFLSYLVLKSVRREAPVPVTA